MTLLPNQGVARIEGRFERIDGLFHRWESQVHKGWNDGTMEPCPHQIVDASLNTIVALSPQVLKSITSYCKSNEVHC